jgi:nicotinamide-nucleotide amidase
MKTQRPGEAEGAVRSRRGLKGAGAELKALLLDEPRLTLAAAESLTCGRVQARVGEVPGASDFFLGGITAYSLDQKVRHLGVDRAAARRVKSVSASVAQQMARGACVLFGSDLGVATTGYAEPSPDDGVVEPFAWWSVAHRRRGRFVAVKSGRVECPRAKRIDAQTIVADAVVAELVAYLRAFRRGKS